MVFVIFNKQTLVGASKLIHWIEKFWKLTFSNLLKVNFLYRIFVNILIDFLSLFSAEFLTSSKPENLRILGSCLCHKLTIWLQKKIKLLEKCLHFRFEKSTQETETVVKEKKNTRQRLRLCFISFIIILRFCWNW